MNARAKAKRRPPRPTHPAQLALVWAEPRKTLKAIERGEKRVGNVVPRDEAKPRTPEERKHVAHCCSNHGCAYDADDCPVEALALRQSSACGAAAPCSAEHGRPVRLPPRPLNLKVPEASTDPRLQHLTGGVRK